MEPLKIIILQDELPKLEVLKDLVNASGYTLKKKHLNDQDVLTLLNKNASQLTVLDIQITNGDTDEKAKQDSNSMGRKSKSTEESFFTLEPIASEISKNQKNQEIGHNSDNQSPFKVSKKQQEAISSHGLIFKENLFIRSNSLLVKLRFEDIIYLEADANYTQVFTTDKKYIIRSSMKELQEKLDDKRFARVHKSFLINLEKIESIQADSIQIDGKEIPIGRPQYSWFLRQITIL